MTTELSCRCGRVRLTVAKQPIITAECHCNSCRTAGDRMLAIQDAPSVQQPNGGTRYVLYRKDRIHILSGIELLREFRLTPKASTRRIIAGCCNTPMFLEFEHGHWLSLYSNLWPQGTAPMPDLRTQTGDLPEGAALDGDIPFGKRQTLGFYARLLGAWIAMGFKSPKLAVNGTLEV